MEVAKPGFVGQGHLISPSAMVDLAEMVIPLEAEKGAYRAQRWDWEWSSASFLLGYKSRSHSLDHLGWEESQGSSSEGRLSEVVVEGG